jgi:hypothetical protein
MTEALTPAQQALLRKIRSRVKGHPSLVSTSDAREIDALRAAGLVRWDGNRWHAVEPTGDLPADALDHEDLILVLHVIDFALEHDRLSRQNFGRDASLTPDARIGINSLRSKIRAAIGAPTVKRA